MKKYLVITLSLALVVLTACTVQLPAAAPSAAPTGAAAFTPPETTTSAVPTFGAAWEAGNCADFFLPAELADHADCGYVTVPAFHRQPDSPTLQVAVVRVRSTGQNPARDPLFMEAGGPGGPSIRVYAVFALPALPNLQAILATRDMVFVDQRGTLHALPNLLCPEEEEHQVQAAKGLVAEDDLGWLAPCRDRLLAAGIDFDAYNSIENAADMYTVAETLGYQSFNFYGNSYGTLLAQYVMDQQGEHAAQLRSAIVDGVVTSSIDFNAAGSYTLSHALRNLFADCTQDELCNTAYPDLENVFFSLLEQMTQKPAAVTMNVTNPAGEVVDVISKTVDGEDLIAAVFHTLYDAGATAALPDNIYRSATESDFQWVGDALAPSYSPVPVATGMHVAMVCAHTNSFQVDPATLFDPPYPQFAEWSQHEAETIRAKCKVIPVDANEPFVLDHTDVPTLVVNGRHDPITPQPYGEAVASELTTAYVYNIPDGGHGSIFANPCPGQIVLDFLADPIHAPDSSCLSTMEWAVVAPDN